MRHWHICRRISYLLLLLSCCGEMAWNNQKSFPEVPHTISLFRYRNHCTLNLNPSTFTKWKSHIKPAAGQMLWVETKKNNKKKKRQRPPANNSHKIRKRIASFVHAWIETQLLCNSAIRVSLVDSFLFCFVCFFQNKTTNTQVIHGSKMKATVMRACISPSKKKKKKGKKHGASLHREKSQHITVQNEPI